MKKVQLCLLILLFVFVSSCEELEFPAEFTASQGTYIGAVHLAYSEVNADDWLQYVMYRFDENTADWIEFAWTEARAWDYTGWDLPNEIIPGKEYRFKMRAHTDKTSFSEFSEEVVGYAFDPEECVITSIDQEVGEYSTRNTISWENPNDLLEIQNLLEIHYHIMRKEENSANDFQNVRTIWEYVDNTSDIDYTYSDVDTQVDKDKTYIYKIETEYRYISIDSYASYSDNNYFEVGGIAYDPVGGNQGNPTVSYTNVSLGELLSATTGNTVFDPKDKVVDGTLYLEAIAGSAAAGGIPSLYKYNGTSWEEVWTCSELNQTMHSHFGVSSTGESWVLGSDGSGSVYKWDGSGWTDLGLPSGVDGYYGLEVWNDEVHVLVESSDVLQLFKYSGSSWTQVGTDIANGTIYSKRMESLNGSLYVSYTISDVLYIKHLSGSSWVSDLQWEQEWLADIELAYTGSQLYFSSGSASTDFDGGVYRVTSGTTVENLIPEEHEAWFTLGAFDLTADSEGNLIVASMKFEYADASQTSLINYPHLNLYDGSEWKTLSGDFTDGILPVTVSAIGTDIHYVYGEKATENEAQYATVLKGRKLSK